MAGSRMKIGQLVPLKPNLVAENSISTIPIFEGMNFVGRNNLVESDKRVSRKHISLCVAVDGSAEVVVEGTNPIVFQSGGKRRKLCSQGKSLIGQGDILELIPGSHLFKYVTVVGDLASPSETNIDISSEVKRPTKESALVVKRNQQVLKDEAFARKLQDNTSLSLVAAKFSGSHSELVMSPASCKDSEPIRHFNVPKYISPLIFKLLRVQGLPAWANCSSVAIDEVIQGNVLVAILANYMVDTDWLTSACPDLRKIPHVLVIHGESGATVEHFKKIKPAHWILHKPPLPISYGTHHSKAMLLVYEEGVRVVVHTANLIHVDWNNKTQGLWMQDFPWKDQKNLNKRCLFEDDLVDYLNTLKWPEFSVNLPMIGNVNINASFFKKFDYSSSMVRLIASVPGYHTGSNLKKWGHMKLQNVLQSCIFDKEFCKSPLVYQFSSLGSLDERWMAEFTSSMSAGISSDKSPLGVGKPLIIWPTVEDVRCSIEGYAAGSCIPSPQKNVEKDFLNKYWARWRANHVGRCRAMPHIKTYTRYNGQNLAWFLLTSANLSKAAWGALQKNNSQLMIRSYELGVLFLPSVIPNKERIFSCTETGALKGEYNTSSDDVKTKLATLCFRGHSTIDSATQVIHLPVPYQLPPQPYTSEDVPWSWDRRYTKKDVYGQVWPR